MHLASVCRRIHRTMRFVLHLVRGAYPVTVTRVQTITRSRKYTFQTSGNPARTFSLCGFRVPLHYILQCAARRGLEPRVGQCQVKPRTGKLLMLQLDIMHIV